MQRTEKTVEFNSDGHADYTYHRHSAPKNIVYYRCSDKRCRARLHYDLVTKQITMKHSHLDPSIHQKPRITKAITIEELTSLPQTKRGKRHTPAPLKMTEATLKNETTFVYGENPVLPIKRERFITVVNSPSSSDCFLARFPAADAERIGQFCRVAVQRGIASKAFHYSGGTTYWMLNGEVSEVDEKGVVECEVNALHLDKLKGLVEGLFGYGTQLSTFRLA
jgi:hypothetical protein